MNKKYDEDPKLTVTEQQRQGLKIANMVVKNWGAKITLTTMVSIHRYNLDDPAQFDQVIKELEFQGHLATAGGDGTKATLEELLDEARDLLITDLEEIEKYIQAALAGKETP